jgi:hypothetical protein
VFTARKYPAEAKCLCGATNLKMAERQRNTKVDQGPLSRMQFMQFVEGLIREDGRVKSHEIGEVKSIAKSTPAL